MAKCSSCAHELGDEFGLVDCPKCGAAQFIEIDGQSSAANSLAEATTPIHLEATAISSAQDGPENFNYDQEIEPPALFAAPDFASDNELDEPPAPTYIPDTAKQTSASADLSDVAEFGNSDAATTRDGPLRYNLRIGGIDTADLRSALKDILTDKRFLWDSEALLRSIKGGELCISDVSAVKAYLLISRLQQLPVSIRWEQYVTHQI